MTWGSQSPRDKQAVKLTGLAAFRSLSQTFAAFRGGERQCKINLPSGSQISLRFKNSDGDTLVQACITSHGVAVVKLADKRNAIFKGVQHSIELNPWHKLSLSFDGPEFFGAVDETILIAVDEVFDRDKAELDFLIVGGPVGLRNFTMNATGLHNQSAQ